MQKQSKLYVRIRFIYIYIYEYRDKLSLLFNVKVRNDAYDVQKVITEKIIDSIFNFRALATFIPTLYGGFGGNTIEAVAMLQTSSYQSHPFSLVMFIVQQN